jgi:hypothetical protein
MVEVKFGICSDSQNFYNSVCKENPNLLCSFSICVMDKVRFHVQSAQSKSLILLQTYEIIAVINHI